MTENQAQRGFPMILQCPLCGGAVEMVYTGTVTLDGRPAFSWVPCKCEDKE